MAALTKGAPRKSTAGAVVDNLLAVVRTASRTLIPGDDQLIHVDPTLADIMNTLPDPELAANIGVEFFIKRTVNGANNVQLECLVGDTIEGVISTNPFGLAFQNDSIHVYSDGTSDWKIKSRVLFSIATMTAEAASFGVTTSFVKFDQWDTSVFETPHKVETDLVNNRINVVEFQGPQDGYEVNFTFNCEYTNNNVVTVQVFADGVPVGLPININALGTGKPISLTHDSQIGITALAAIELRVKAENAGTITNIGAELQVTRVGR